jgi:hypothetical protein
MFLLQVPRTTYDDLRVCYSRKNEQPRNTSNDVTCKQTIAGDVEIKLDNPCDGFEYISQCPPLYISVTSDAIAQQPSCNHGKNMSKL